MGPTQESYCEEDRRFSVKSLCSVTSELVLVFLLYLTLCYILQLSYKYIHRWCQKSDYKVSKKWKTWMWAYCNSNMQCVQNTNLYDCRVSAFIFTFTSGAELLLFSFDIIPNLWKNYSVTVTVRKPKNKVEPAIHSTGCSSWCNSKTVLKDAM